jgi:hypothetical protein
MSLCAICLTLDSMEFLIKINSLGWGLTFAWIPV